MNDHHNMNAQTITALRAQIMSAVPNLECPSFERKQPSSGWWLLGTAGCHLCTQAEQLLARFQLVQPLIYQHVDIADFDEPLMMQFATTIPVLLTPTKRLDYPFSVMDLQQLLIAETTESSKTS